MNRAPDYFSSMEVIWLIWLGSAVLTAGLTIGALNRLSWQQLKRVVLREDGAAYTLSYVMVVPIYILLICTVVETTFMLVAKMGTVYSSFAAARTAIVWYPATTEDDAVDRTERAAIRAMLPFASGLAELEESPDQSATEADIDSYIKAYNEYLQGMNVKPKSERYLRAKYRYAAQATRLDPNPPELKPGDSGEAWDENIVVTVTYDFPFSLPGLGRLFHALGVAERGSNGGFIYPIKSTATLQNEVPQNDQKRLGISYASPPK